MNLEDMNGWYLSEHSPEEVIKYALKVAWQETYEFINSLPTKGEL